MAKLTEIVNLKADVTYVDTAVSGFQTSIDNNTTNINNEVTRATGVEGDLTTLTTDVKDTLVNAINEIDGKLLTDVPENAVFTDTVYDKAELGDLTTLTTDVKDTLVNAINEIDGNVDTNTTAISTINAKSVKYTNFVFTGDDSTTAFVCNDIVFSLENTLVFNGGSKEAKVNYTVSNDGTDTTVTFTTAPVAEAIVEVEVITYA